MSTKILVLVLSFVAALAGHAQNDASAKKILDEVSKKYDGYKTLMAEFSFKANQDGSPYTDAGNLRLERKTNKYRITLKDQEIISDGKSVWGILKEQKEIQVTEADHSNTSTIGPNNLFSFYKTGYQYKLLKDEKVDDNVLNVIELSPTGSNNALKIKLRINKNKHIHDMTVYDKSGSSYSYTIHKLFVNQSFDNKYFTFQKSSYSGYEIVDLR